MNRYVESIKQTTEEFNIISELTQLHPEEYGNRKLNNSFRDGFEDIKFIDKTIKDLGNKTYELLNRTSDRLETVLDIITLEKERLQDISMLCNLKTDFDNVIPLTDYHFTGDYTFDNGVFSSKTIQSANNNCSAIDVIGNGYEGNKYVKKDNGYLENILNTKNKKNMTDNNISTYWEYSRITASNTEEYLISDFNTDGAEAKCTVTLKFNEVTNEIAIKTELKTLKVVGIKYSNDNLHYTDLDIVPFIINNKEESYKNQDYIYGSNIIAFPNSLYIKITFESTAYLDDLIAFERTITTDNDQTEEITTIVKSAKRHVIRLNNIEARRKQYVGESIFKSKELISGNKDIYAISIFANIYLPDNLSDDSVKFTLTINGVDYEILPINSYKNGIKMIRFSQGKMPTEYTKYIGEKITSAYLTVSIKSKNKITPYINNLKVLLGGEI